MKPYQLMGVTRMWTLTSPRGCGARSQEAIKQISISSFRNTEETTNVDFDSLLRRLKRPSDKTKWTQLLVLIVCC